MIWSPSSYKNFTALQQPVYEDMAELEKVRDELASYPPLVFALEAKELKNELAQINQGKAFLLQGGDCAQSFAEFSANNIRDMFKLFLQMALVLQFGSAKKVIKVARTAGQYAKPRSSDIESKNGVSLPSYRGDIINDFKFCEEARKADPRRMLKAYSHSAATLNLLRAFSVGGLAELARVHQWNLGFLRKDKTLERYLELTERLSSALEFFKTCGIDSAKDSRLRETTLYTSHEALLLPYEEALTRQDSLSGEFYDCSAHMLWIGERTRGIDDAHVHFLSGVKNPIGCKIGPNATPDEVLRLAEKLNPANEAGRLNLIFRCGKDKVKNAENIIRHLVREGAEIIYSCDPMHGNTQSLNGYKTRYFDDILEEVSAFFDITKSSGAIPGGVHFEMTGQNVTECLGGSVGPSAEQLSERYETQCDPRLNADQALELAFLIVDLIKK